MAKASSKSNESMWSAAFKAMGDPTRLSILLTLMKGEQCVTDIAKGLKMDAPKVSFHLTRLRYAGLLAQERTGQKMIYRISPQVAKKGSENVMDIQGCQITFTK